MDEPRRPGEGRHGALGAAMLALAGAVVLLTFAVDTALGENGATVRHWAADADVWASLGWLALGCALAGGLAVPAARFGGPPRPATVGGVALLVLGAYQAFLPPLGVDQGLGALALPVGTVLAVLALEIALAIAYAVGASRLRRTLVRWSTAVAAACVAASLAWVILTGAVHANSW